MENDHGPKTPLPELRGLLPGNVRRLQQAAVGLPFLHAPNVHRLRMLSCKGRRRPNLGRGGMRSEAMHQDRCLLFQVLCAGCWLRWRRVWGMRHIQRDN